MNAPILFLDFDGVLHTLSAKDEFFSCAAALANVLATSSVDVVLTSDWRLKQSLSSLKSLLPDEIASRVVDATGWHPYGRYRRFREIMLWLAETNRSDTPWIALDDSLTHFPPGFGGLLWCDPQIGFSGSQAAALSKWLRHPKVYAATLDDEWHHEDLTRMTPQELSELVMWLRASGHDDRFDVERFLVRGRLP